MTSMSKVLAESIPKPLLDNREYKFIELPNKINALLIHDPTTDLAGASLDVHVGSYKDNTYKTPGLAHFCEHLLFMGTKKYPDENEYQAYLSKHGGHSNAYTSFEHTNYYFELNSEFLSGALDRFSQFFISPIFEQSCKDREINAVDSENKKNLQNDIWRFYQLSKSTSNPNHPYNHFATGNFNTLNKPNVRDILLEFHSQNYSANLMSLVILGSEPLDVLTDYAITYFGDVVNKDLSRPLHEEKIYTPRELGKLVKAHSIMDSNKLQLDFLVPDQETNWKYLPSNYYSHLIGHESEGSIYYYLNELGYINGLSSGHSKVCNNSGLFIIDIELTDLGMEKWQEIIVTVFQYLKLVESSPLDKNLFNEVKQMMEINFKFKQKQNVANTISKMSNTLYKYNSFIPSEFVLNHQTKIEFNEEQIRKFGSCLKLDNLRITWASNKFKSLPLVEKWYGTNYSYEDIPSELGNSIENAHINPKLHFPVPNQFVPENFKIYGEKLDLPLKHPYLLKNSDKFQIWFKIDDTFQVPKSSINLFLHLPESNKDITTTILTQLYCELFEDELNDISYYASLVGQSFNIMQWRDGILIKLSGYNDKISILLKEILLKLVGFNPKPTKFDIIKYKLLQDFKNFDYDVPYLQVNSNLLTLINEKTYLTRDKYPVLEKLTYDELMKFTPKLYNSIFVESLITGNNNLEELQKLSQLFEKTFSRIPAISNNINEVAQQVKLRSMDFNKSCIVNLPMVDPDNVNSCLEYFIKVGYMGNYELRAKIDLIVSILSEPCFNQLRTKEQLGYVVFSSTRLSRNYFGYRILVQSEKSGDYLISRIEAFLSSMADYLHDMNSESFERFKLALIDKKLIKLKNLTEETTKFWNCITDGYYDFTINDKLVEILKTLTKEDIVDCYNAMLQKPKLILKLNSHKAKFTNLKKVIDGQVSDDIITNLENDLDALNSKLSDIDLHKEMDTLFPKNEYEEIDYHQFKKLPYCNIPLPVEPLSNFFYNEVHL